MKRMAIAALALAGCSTTVAPADVGVASDGLLHGIEACHRNMFDGVPVDRAVAESARGRTYARDDRYDVVSGISPPGWKLAGEVRVGATDRGGCNIYISSGDGPELRNLALATHFGMSSRRWIPMKIIAAPRGEVRDAVCTTDRMPAGKSVGVVMTSRLDSTVTDRRAFIATVMLAAASDCTERQFP